MQTHYVVRCSDDEKNNKKITLSMKEDSDGKWNRSKQGTDKEKKNGGKSEHLFNC